MQVTPLSFLPKEASSPRRIINHHDSLVFSITSEKYNSRKQTLLLDESKQMNRQKNQSFYSDYFVIQDKIKSLEEKVQNIKTNYCQSSDPRQNKQLQNQNRPSIANLQFPEEIYINRNFLHDERCQIGKIKRKKQKRSLEASQKLRSKSRSHTKIDDSIMTTKRNNLSSYNVHDFSVYRTRNSFSKQKETNSKEKIQRQRSSLLAQGKKQTKFEHGHISQLKKLKKQLSRNRLSIQKLSRKSKQSQRKLSISKNQTVKLRNQNTQLQKSLNQVQQKLKRSQKIRQKQKQIMQQQKQEIQQLKCFLEEVLKRNNDETLRQSFYKDKDKNGIKLKMLR